MESFGYGIGYMLGIVMAWGMVINLVSAFICCFMAAWRDRNVFMGLMGGLFFGVFSIIYYLIAGDSVEKKARRQEEARINYYAEELAKIQADKEPV